MNWHLRLAPAFSVLVILATGFSDAQDKKEDKKAPPFVSNYYPLQVGAQWTFKVTVGENSTTAISRIAKLETIDKEELARLEATVNGNVVATEHLRQTGEGVFRHRNNGAEIVPPIRLLKFPVKDKDKWEGNINVGADKGKYFCETKEENVEVPGYKGPAMKVSIRLEGKGQTVNTAYWFVKDIGFVKQSVDAGGLSILMELEKFEQNKAAPK